MDHTRDNPFIRIKAFFDGIGIFTFFGLLLLLILGIGALFGFWEKGETPEDAAGDIRYEIKGEVDKAQAEFLTRAQIEESIDSVAAQLSATSPLAVNKPEQIVPGSPTAKKLEEAPGPDLTAVDAVPENPDAVIDPALMEVGKAQFLVCGACHGQNGEGGPAGPPLAGSEWVSGPVSNLIIIQLRGLKGPITVKGTQYEFPAGMTPMGYQTDDQIAGVLTYIRNSFGNKGSAVSPEQVTALRGEVGKPQATVEELTQP